MEPGKGTQALNHLRLETIHVVSAQTLLVTPGHVAPPGCKGSRETHPGCVRRGKRPGKASWGIRQPTLCYKNI